MKSRTRPILAALLLLACSAALAAPPCKPGLTELDLPDGGHYCGQVKNGKLHGQGRIDWGQGRYYQGGFAGGFKEGRGRQVGGSYVYEGEFKRGERSGIGKLTWGGDSVYVGQFAHGEQNGQGKLTQGKDVAYEGQFARSQMNGQGKLVSDGIRFEGQFKNDQPSGHVRMTDSDGVIIEGQFDGDDFVGPATVLLPTGERFEGPVEDDRPHGEGAWTRADKAVVRGKFASGILIGEGSIQYPGGAVYTGPVRSRKAHGKGTLRRPNGDVYAGEFAADQFDGQGVLTQANGSVQTGFWRAGKYLGEHSDGDVTLADTPELAARNNEAALYNQQALLDQQFAQLQQSPAEGPARMYALLVAGDGSQEVFRREAAYVDNLLARRFDTRGRTVSLVNSRSSVERLPLATGRGIELALAALAQKMNRQRDLLFVYLTSHGSSRHEFALDLGDMDFPRLTPQRLRELLDATGIRNKVVVISACYSGGFIPALQGERTWVITAARADRASFGCADENDFTYFGRALFKESLPAAPTLSAAFARASQLVREWEQRGDPQDPPDATAQTPPDAPQARASASNGEDEGGDDDDEQQSQPQSAVSPAFQSEVDAWFRARPAVAAP